jgi:hypothetical protein
MNFKTFKYILLFFGIISLIHGCANRGAGPTGGPKDTIPPQVVKSIPPFGSLNFKKKQIQIFFNEMVSVDKPSENIIISPPQVKPPDVKAYSKYVTVNFNEELKDSTTYTINFGKAIVDLNENNALKNYMFSFSTGNEIDTLQISGVVLDAENLNPLSGIIVGIYSEASDSVFFKKPFMRIGKTDDKGHFTIYNMKKGKYKLFALDDTNHDYFYESGEGLAMCDSMITPIWRREQMRDTIWKDSTHFDSVRTYIGTRFLPDDLALKFFRENKKRQYFVKAERLQPFTFSLYFNAPAAKLPEFKPLNFKWDNKYLLQKNNELDSLTFWLTDSIVWNVDTLRMAMTYLKSDSLYRLKSVTDTLNISMRKARVNRRAKPVKKEAVKIEPLRITNNLSPSFDVYRPVLLNFDAPLSGIDLSKIKLRLKKDTVYKEIPFKWRQVDSTKMAYAIDYKWLPETSYQLKIDSAAFVSIYNKTSSTLKTDFKIKSLDEYSSIKMILDPFNPKAMVQVLDSKDALLETLPASPKGTLFQYLKPGDYYVRMFIDTNGNGKWDTGDLSARRQPEEVYYYPKKLTLKANWDFEETWDYKQIPLLKQKPAELKKLAVKKTPNN